MKINCRIFVIGFFIVSLTLLFVFFHGGNISVKSTILSSEPVLSVRNEIDKELMYALPVHLKHGDTEGIHQTGTGIDTEPDVQGESNPKIVKDTTPKIAMETNSDVQDIVKESNAEVVKDTTPKIAMETNYDVQDIVKESNAEVVKDTTPKIAMETNYDVQDIVKESNAEVVKETIRKVANKPNSEGVDVFEMSTAEREKFQQNQVERYCKRYHLEDRRLKIPRKRGHPIFRHLLPNDKAKTLLCFAPKVGCTSLKTLYYTTQGLIPKPKDFFMNDPKLQWVVNTYSFVAKNNTECEKDITTYYKFVMYRHPLDRLLSAYRDKVRLTPMHTLADVVIYHNWYKKMVYKHTHPVLYKKWAAKNGMTPINITFTDFITFWLEAKDPWALQDPHFIPMSQLCDPCRTRFHFYGDFDNFDQDASVLFEKIGGDLKSLHPGYYKDTKQTTHNLVKDHFSLLTLEQKRGVLKRLSPELDFYYQIFPSKRNSHKEILDMTDDLILPQGVEPF